MFYFNYVKLCNRKGISPTAAAIEMGFNKSMVTRWGKGSAPRSATLQRVADYFGVTVEYLLSGEDAKSPATQLGSGANEERLLLLFRQLNAVGQQKALDYISDLTEIYKNHPANYPIQKNA